MCDTGDLHIHSLTYGKHGNPQGYMIDYNMKIVKSIKELS